MKLHIELAYKIPSVQNQPQHWAVQMREKRKAQLALLSGLYRIAHGYWTKTTCTGEAKRCSMLYDTLVRYMTTPKRKSTTRLGKSKWRTVQKKKR